MSDKKPKYIEGIGWRYETEHSQKRRRKKHRYNDVATYLVTIVVEGRKPVFGSIGSTPAIVLSPLGVKVLNQEIPKIHAIYPMVEVWKPICIMPDHIHLIIRINSPLPPKKHLGTIVGAFKGGVTRAWHEMGNDRLTPDTQGHTLATDTQGHTLATETRGHTLATETRGHTLAPLFEDNYNDRILMRDGHLENWKAYLRDNPYRRFVMHTRPDLMQRSLCLVIGGIRYGAFGNFLLLRHPEKVQVFFHRRMVDDRLTPDTQGHTLAPDTQGHTLAPDTQGRTLATDTRGHTLAPDTQGETWRLKIPTEQTLFWHKEHERLMEIAEQGDVLVTPGISECEKRIKNECLSEHYRLIHIQDKPIGRYWKPEKSRFEACMAGTLLILAPWAEDLEGDNNYERFHNLNALAATVCALDADTTMQVTEAGGTASEKE